MQAEAVGPDLFEEGGLQDHVLAGTSARDGSDQRPAKRGRGRPPGALNKATLEERERILEMINPLDNLIALAALSIDELASRLKMKMPDAAEYYRKLQNDLAQYTHSKMPQAHIVQQVPPVPINMHFGDDEAVTAEQGPLIDITPINSTTYEDAHSSVTASPSPRKDKPLKNKDSFDAST